MKKLRRHKLLYNIYYGVIGRCNLVEDEHKKDFGDRLPHIDFG